MTTTTAPPLAAAPTAPGRMPVLGHAARLAVGRLDFLQTLRGQGDIVRVHLGPRPVYVVNAPELIRSVLTTQAASFDKGRFFEKMRPVLGTGILTADTEPHRRQRPLVQPAFHHERIRGYVDIMNRLTLDAVTRWQPGQVLAFDQEMHALALRIVATSLFSSDVGERAVTATQRLFPAVSLGVARRTLSPFPWLERLPTPGNRRFEAAVAELWAVIDMVIAAYRAQAADHGDLLSMLLAAHDENGTGRLSDREIRDEAVTLLGAGTETSSNSLSWLFHELDRHPDVQERLRAEIDGVVGPDGVRYEQIKELTYTQQAVNEVLRLHTPIWILMRRAVTEVELGGQLLRPGDEIVFSPTALHRDPAIYPDPLRFDPDRWSPERESERQRHSYIPFGMGSRRCIGDVFARVEMSVITAVILSRWKLRSADGKPVRAVCTGSLHPARLPMRVTPR